MKFTAFKRPVLSAVAFFGTLGILSVGYSAYVSNYPATATNGGTLSSTEWNKMVSALQTLDSNLSNFTFVSPKKAVFGTTTFTTPYSGYDTQNNTALEIGASWAEPALGVLNLTTGNVGVVTFATRGTSAIEKRSALIGSKLESDSTSAVVGNLVFQTNNGTAVTEKMRIASNGNVGIGNASPQAKLDVGGAVVHDGVMELNWAGDTNCNQTVSLTFTHKNYSAFEVTAMFTHYGYQSTYGATRKSLVSNGSGLMQTTELANVTSANCGSWNITRNSETSVTITKTAGTYNGGGPYFVTVRWNGGFSK